MLSPEALDRLVDAMRRTGVTELSLAGDGDALTLKCAAPTLPVLAVPAPAKPAPIAVKSPGLGRFVPRGAEDGLSVLAPGDRVAAGEILGHLALDEVRLPVISPAAGRLAGAFPETGRVTGHGDVLFHLEASA